MFRRLALTPLVLLIAGPAWAQHRGQGGGLTTTAPTEARQFDFLVGQWDLDVRPAVSGLAARLHGAGRMKGVWKAWRAFDGFGIEDELRIVDPSGNPAALSYALRLFDAAGREWSVTAVDVYRARTSSATGRLEGGDLVLLGRGNDAEGRPVVTRTRFTGIEADRFRMLQERSTDGGRRWSEHLRIDARRTAESAPR